MFAKEQKCCGNCGHLRKEQLVMVNGQTTSFYACLNFSPEIHSLNQICNKWVDNPLSEYLPSPLEVLIKRVKC